MSYGDSETSYDGPEDTSDLSRVEVRRRPGKPDHPTIGLRLDACMKALALLDESVDGLSGRLEMVLRPSRPTPLDGAVRDNEADASALQDHLERMADQLNGVRRRVDDLAGRVDL